MKNFLIALIFLGLNYQSYSQTEEESTEEGTEESFEVLDSADLDEFGFSEIDDFNISDLPTIQPMIKLGAGIATPTYMGADLGQLDVYKMVFGFSTTGVLKFANKDSSTTKLRNYSDYGFLVENYNHRSDILSDYTADPRQFSFWKFGFSSSEGLGYILGDNADIILGQESGMGWQSMNYSYSVTSNTMGTPIIETNGKVDPRLKLEDTYTGGTRFSQYYEAFIKVRPISNVAINLSYKQDLIYPRFMFWHAVSSNIIEGVADYVAEAFANKITRSSPYIGPVAHFILKNAVSFAFMELRKNNQNWPIKSADPLIINSMNFGISFHF